MERLPKDRVRTPHSRRRQQVNLAAKTEYACLAALDLAAHHDSVEPVRIRDIADRHGIPARFLVQILLQLKGAGLVSSTRGASGGYQLARAPEEISLGEVITVMEGRPGAPQSSATKQTPAIRVLLNTWRHAMESQYDLLDSCTLAELAERARGETEMYYI